MEGVNLEEFLFPRFVMGICEQFHMYCFTVLSAEEIELGQAEIRFSGAVLITGTYALFFELASCMKVKGAIKQFMESSLVTCAV